MHHICARQPASLLTKGFLARRFLVCAGIHMHSATTSADGHDPGDATRRTQASGCTCGGTANASPSAPSLASTPSPSAAAPPAGAGSRAAPGVPNAASASAAARRRARRAPARPRKARWRRCRCSRCSHSRAAASASAAAMSASRWMKLAVACHTKSLGRLVTSTALQKPDTASRRQGGRCADARRAADLPQALQARHRAEVVRVGVGPEVGAVAQRERGDPARRRGAPGRALLQQAPHALVGRRLRHAGARFRGILPEYCGSSTLSSENGKRNGSSNKVD